MSAAEALKVVSDALGANQARRIICTRAYRGLITARAVRLVLNGYARDDVKIYHSYWIALGKATARQNWEAGDFDTMYKRRNRLQVFGVSFLRSGIEALIEPATSIPKVAGDAPTNSGGRPRADWWDDLWAEIARQLYVGELKPKRQAQIEDAMMTWLAARGIHPAISTIRKPARKLQIALNKEDEI